MKKLLALMLCAAELLLFAGRDGLRSNYREVEELLVIQTMGLDKTGSGVKLSLAAAGDSEDLYLPLAGAAAGHASVCGARRGSVKRGDGCRQR